MGYIKNSQIHECRNWERGRTVSFLGIFVSNFRYIAFAVHVTLFTNMGKTDTILHHVVGVGDRGRSDSAREPTPTNAKPERNPSYRVGSGLNSLTIAADSFSM